MLRNSNQVVVYISHPPHCPSKPPVKPSSPGPCKSWISHLDKVCPGKGKNPLNIRCWWEGSGEKKTFSVAALLLRNNLGSQNYDGSVHTKISEDNEFSRAESAT